MVAFAARAAFGTGRSWPAAFLRSPSTIEANAAIDRKRPLQPECMTQLFFSGRPIFARHSKRAGAASNHNGGPRLGADVENASVARDFHVRSDGLRRIVG